MEASEFVAVARARMARVSRIVSGGSDFRRNHLVGMESAVIRAPGIGQ